MKNTFVSEQVPSPVRQAIQKAIQARMEDRGLSTYGVAASMGASQSTVFNAITYGRFGALFATRALEWLNMDVEAVVKKFGDPSATKALVVAGIGPAPVITPSIKTLASKLKWSEITVTQVQLLFETANRNVDIDTLKRCGNMYEAVNRDVLEGS